MLLYSLWLLNRRTMVSVCLATTNTQTPRNLGTKAEHLLAAPRKELDPQVPDNARIGVRRFHATWVARERWGTHLIVGQA